MKRKFEEIVDVAGLSPEDQELVLDHGRHFLLEDCDVDVSEYHVAVRHGQKLSIQDQKRLQPLFRLEELIDEHPVAAMLVSGIDGSYQEKNKHRRLKRYVLKGAVRFPDKGDAIKLACRRVRNLDNSEMRWILDALPKEPSNLPDVVSNLVELERRIEEEGDSDDKRWKLRRCADLIPLLRWLKNDEATRRGGGPRTKSGKDQESIAVSEIDDDVRDDDLAGSIVQAVSVTKGELPDAEPIESQCYLDPGLQAAPSYRSYEAKQRRNARHAGNEIRSRLVAAPCSWQGLTENEVRVTLTECVASAVEHNSPAAALIVLSILLGRKPTDLLGLLFLNRRSNKPEGGYWYARTDSIRFVTVLNMPRFKANEFAARVADASVTQLDLPIPKLLQSVLRNIKSLDPEQRQSDSAIAGEVKSILSDTNRTHGTRLTESRLASFIQVQLAAKGVDDVVIRRIRGFSLLHNVPQHYDGCPTQQTLDTYIDYANEIVTWAGLDGDLDAVSCPAAPLGSQLQIQSQYVRSYFDTWSTQIDTIRRSATPLDFHNEFALATYAILAIATGHRPVRGMFENIKDYDPISRELFIADKNLSNGADTRCIVLGAVASQQLDNYINHLGQLIVTIGSANIITVRAAKRALSGKGPLIFRVHRQANQPDTIQAFDPGLVEQWLADKFPVDLKWTRHFLRTKASEAGLPFEGTNAMLGHNGCSPASFNPFSGLSYRDLVRYADRYDAVLSEYGVQPIKGLAA